MGAEGVGSGPRVASAATGSFSSTTAVYGECPSRGKVRIWPAMLDIVNSGSLCTMAGLSAPEAQELGRQSSGGGYQIDPGRLSTGER